MKNKVTILFFLVFAPVLSLASEIVSFTLDNRRADGNNYLVDIVADVADSEEWTVSSTTFVIDYNVSAINPISFDGDNLNNLNSSFNGTDYKVFQTMFTDDDVAVNILSAGLGVTFSSGKHTIGTIKFAILDTTLYDNFDFINKECIVFDGLNELQEGDVSGDSYSLNNPWNRRIKSLLWHPYLQSPSNNERDVALITTFNWTDVNNANSYDIQISKNNSFNAVGIIFKQAMNQSTYTTIQGNLENNTHYYWRVNAYNSTDTSYWSDTYEFTTERKLVAPNLTSPTDEETSVAISSSFYWDPVQGADGYDILVSEEVNFTNSIINDEVTGSNTYIPNQSEIKYNMTYYWKVRAKRNGGDIGPWSDVFWFSTDELNPPVLNYPADQAVNIPVDGVNLTWDNAEFAVKYYLEVADDESFGVADLIVQEEVAGNSYNLSGLLLNTKYFWRVQSIADNSQKSIICESKVRSFTTENLVAPPLIIPNQSACFVSTMPNFEWEAIMNADSYELEVATTSDFIQANIVYEYAGTSTSVTLSANDELDEGKVYYWRVRSKIGSVWYSNWSSHYTFTTDVTVDLNTPVDAATDIVRNNPQFTWSSISNAQRYQLQVSTTNQFGDNDIVETVVTSGNTGQITYLNRNSTFYWRVRVDLCGIWSDWSIVRSFTTEDWEMSRLLYPNNNAVDFGISSNLIWQRSNEANSYEVQVAEDDNFTVIDYELLTTATGKALPKAEYYHTYHWRVRAVNDHEKSAWSEGRTFTTEKSYCKWTVNPTAYKHTISVPTSITPHIGDRDIENDDWVGVFFDSDGQGTYKLGGAAEWDGTNMTINVYGDDPNTPIVKEGFADDEAFVFRFWDAHHGEEVDAIATFASGPGDFENQGQTVLSSLEGEALDELDLNLSLGWNLISSYVIPEDLDLSDVFSDLNTLLIVRNSQNKIYFPNFNIFEFTTWNNKESYSIYMRQAERLTFYGHDAEPQNIDINLSTGWNSPGYLNNKTAPVSTVLSTITANMLILKNGEGKIYFPNLNIFQFTDMVPGEGYKCYMTAADVLTYPANSTLKPIVRTNNNYPTIQYLIPQHSTINTAHTIIDTDFADGFEIGAYNQSGELIGSGVVYQGRAVVTMFGYDSMDNLDFGAKSNEKINFFVYNPKRKTIEKLEFSRIKNYFTQEDLTSIRYEADAIISAKATAEVSNIFENSNLCVLPSPASDNVEIEFNAEDIDSDLKLIISIFDVNGKLVKEVFSGRISDNDLRFNLDVSHLSSGMYTVIATYDGQDEMKKLIIER